MQLKQVDFLQQNIEKILKQAATGLAYMNASGYVHRDVKPANILVNGLAECGSSTFAIAYRPPTGLAKFFGRKRKARARAAICRRSRFAGRSSMAGPTLQFRPPVRSADGPAAVPRSRFP